MLELVRNALTAASTKELADNILGTFTEIERKYYLQEWKTSELEAGHFVEAVRRFIELKLFGTYTPIGTTLPSFSTSLLQNLEKQQGNEAFRLLIPRVLLSIYNIRNKRGIGHLSLLAANRQDATFILSACKWVLAELFRIEAIVSTEEANSTVNKIGERTTEAIWDIEGIRRILHSNLSIKDQVLVLLFDRSPLSFKDIKTSTESKNDSYLRKILKALHDERAIELTADGICHLSPIGKKLAENKVLSLNMK